MSWESDHADAGRRRRSHTQGEVTEGKRGWGDSEQVSKGGFVGVFLFLLRKMLFEQFGDN